jgi:hypothetical protein
MSPNNTQIFFSAAALLITLLVSNISFSQTDYNMNLTQPVMISENVIEFEVYIRSVNNNFYLTSYQCSFLFNSAIAKGGTLNFTYVEGTSQLINLPSFGVGINSIDGMPKLTFASMADLDTITEMQKLVGRFRLQNTGPFTNSNPNITWSFEGIVSTILTGETFQNITVPANHTYNLTLGFDSQTSAVLDEYKLFQNYPNPFNPTTKIRYTIPSAGTSLMKLVQLKVYDVLGNEVAALVDEYKEAGAYEENFDASGLASGMYLYRLQAGDFISTKKLILIR